MNFYLRNSLFYVFFCCLSIFLFGCEADTHFSEKEPYSVMVQRYRNYLDAENTLERVREKGLNAYIVSNNSPEEGQWYSILISAAPDLEPMMEQKIKYEDNYGLKELKIVNYNKLKDSFLPIRARDKSGSKTTALRPGVGFEVHDLIRELPSSTYYRPVAMKLFHSSDSINIEKLSPIKKIQMDFPRGISQTSLIKNSEAIAEVVYEDDLSYQRLTVQMISLKTDNVYGDSINYFFSKKILDTREYEVEEMNPLSFGGKLGLEGYMVNITPRPNRLKRYAVLMDSKKQFIVFLQSETNNEQAMKDFLNLIGETSGLQNYASFHNTFYTLPRTLPLDDHLAYFELELQRDLEGSIGLLREGQYKSRFVMNTKGKGTWEILLYTMSDLATSQKVFNVLYKNTNRIKKDSITVFGQHAWRTTSRRVHPIEKKYKNMVNEIQFATDKYICIFSNKNRAWLTEEELLSKVRGSQIIVSYRETDDDGFF